MFDGAPEGSSIGVALSTDSVRYELTLQFSGGRIEPLAGERLASIPRGEILINRLPGTSRADLYSIGLGQSANFDLREPERLSLNRYLDYTDCDEAAELDRILHFVRSYHSRSFNLYRLKRYGSESSYETTVWTFANNLWSVLRNLESKRRLDNRYETVMGYMRKLSRAPSRPWLSSKPGQILSMPSSWRKGERNLSWPRGFPTVTSSYSFY